MQRRQLIINAVMSVLQLLANTVVLFVLSRFIIDLIGIEKFGIWSLVLATTSMARLGDLGVSASVVKYIAKYVALRDEKKVCEVIQTALVTNGVVFGVLISVGYFFAGYILSHVVPYASLHWAMVLLPYALVSFWISSLSGVFSSGLDGYQRIDVKSIMLIGVTVLNLFVCFFLIPKYGLLGLAYAQVLQAAIVFVLSWFLLKRQLRNLPILPYRWNNERFREMFSYGVNFQVMSVISVLWDPITKSLLSQFGGLSSVGYYELANRLVTQFRYLIINAMNAMVPVIAELHEKNREMVNTLYEKSYSLVFYIAIPAFGLLAAVLPALSQVWLGYYSNQFVLFSYLITFAYLILILSAPASTAYTGIGDLKWYTRAFIVSGALNLVLGYILGRTFGDVGVIISFALAYVVMSMMIYISYHLSYHLPLKNSFPPESGALIIFSLIGLALSLWCYYNLGHVTGNMGALVLSITIYVAVTVAPVWRHSMRKRFVAFLQQGLANKVAISRA